MKSFASIMPPTSLKPKLLTGIAALAVVSGVWAVDYPVRLQSGHAKAYVGQEIQFRVLQPGTGGSPVYELLTVLPGECRYLGANAYTDSQPLTVGNVACRFPAAGTHRLNGYGGALVDVATPAGTRKEPSWFGGSKSQEAVEITVLPQIQPTLSLELPESRLLMGKPARFTVRVTGLDPGLPLAGAIQLAGGGNATTLRFADGSRREFEIAADGTVSGEFVPATAGAFRFTAQLYRKSDAYASVSSASVDILVDKGVSGVSLNSSAPAVHGRQEIVLSGKVNGTSPTGTVTVVSGARLIGVASLDPAGNYAVRASLTPGAYSLVAKYGGDSNHAASESAPLALTADNAGPSQVALRTSLKDVVAGKPTVLVAAVSGDRPGGWVSFYEGTRLLGRAPVLDGIAMLSATFATPGAHEVRAEYEGDAGNLPSNSGGLPVGVGDAPTGGADSNERRYVYDKVGNLVSATDKRGHTLQVAYDAMNRPVMSVNAVGGLSRTRYNGQGQAVAQVDADGRGETAEFDNFLRLVRQIDGLGNKTEYGYEIADGSGAGLPGSLQDPTEVRYPTFTRRMRLDAQERPTSETLLNPTPAGTEALVSGRSYDVRGLLKTDTDAYGKTTKFEYDEHGRLTLREDSLGHKTRLSYDVRGNLLALTDANGNTYRFEYDRNDRVTKEILPLGQTTIHTYDAAGNAETRTDPTGRKLVRVYDALDRIKETRLYDASGQLLRTTLLSWDAENHLTGWSDTDLTRPAGQQASSGTLGYDEAGRKRSESVTLPDPAGGSYTWRYGYEYTPAGLKKRLIWPEGTALDYGYSAHGELQSVAIPGEGLLSVAEFQWRSPTQLVFPGGTALEKRYDGLLKPLALKVKNPGQQTVLELANSYGRSQELKTSRRSDSVGGASSHHDGRYAYDDENRLREAEVSGSLGNEVESFTLDGVGNRTAHSRVNGAWTYDANNRLKSRGSGAEATSYDHDDAGNLIRKTEPGGKVWEYRYDALNRLVEVRNGAGQPVARYGYDPFHRRLWKEQYRDARGSLLVPAQRSYYLYADEGLIAEARQAIALAGDSSSATQPPQLSSQYGPRPDAEFTTGHLFVKTLASNGQPVVAYFHHDHLGTPVQATDRAGRVVWSAHFNAFGQARITTPEATADQPTITASLRLPGQIEDVETGLHYNFHRYYDAAAGRYVQSDPIGLAGGIHTYAYVEGNPLSRVDPYGLFGMDDVWGAVYDMSGGWTPPQGTVDAIAGFGDAASVGATSLIRDAAEIDGGVDKCSAAYRAGGWVTAVLGGGRLAYAGLAKAGSVLASSGAAASAFRSQLRVAFGGGKSLRPPDLSRYPTDAALRGAAGRTNPYANGYGAAAAAKGSAQGSGCGCP